MTQVRSERVLILEDDAGVAHLERLRLERAGYAVAVATTPDEARTMIVGGGVDLMVLDYRLQDGASGLDFHNRLREAGLVVPSILVTGFGDERILADALRSGIRDFLPKTLDYLDYLVPAVGRVMAQVRTETQLTQERAKLIRERAARAETEAAREILAEVDRRKDEFLAMLAHELRNPLAALTNAICVLKEEEAPDDREWAVGIAERQVSQMTRLLDDLLDISRISSGKIQLKRVVLDATSVVGQAVDVVRPLVEERGHTLEVAVAPGPLWVEADPTRLEQVVVNLLTNAAKYTDRGGQIGVDVRLEGKWVTFTIRDDGVGIAPEMLPRIFEMFTQVESSIDRARGGLGIGLGLVRRLVEMHGGSVEAESPGPKQGSTFRVRLPLAARVEAPKAPGPAAGAPARGARLRVLVVDDNEDTARGMAWLLTRAEYEVRTAHDGPTALEVAHAFRPDCVLLDLGLPGLDGFEVGAQLRREESSRHTMLVAVSGYSQERDRTRTTEAGFDHHLIKPVDVDALLGLLGDLAGRGV